MADRTCPSGVSRIFRGCFGGISVFATSYKDVMIISYTRNVMDAAPPFKHEEKLTITYS